VYMMKSKGPEFEPYGTLCCVVPQSEKKFFTSLDSFTLTFVSYL
jgi:hypothetical protein